MKKILLSLSLMVAPVSMYADALSTQILQNSESLQAAKLSLKGDELALRTEGNLPDPEIEMEIMACRNHRLNLPYRKPLNGPAYIRCVKRQENAV